MSEEDPIERLLKSMSDDDLTSTIKEGYRIGAQSILIYIEIRMRLHECEHHGQEGSPEDWKDELCKLQESISTFFESMAPK